MMIAALAVVAFLDVMTKRLLRRSLGSRTLRLGPFGTLQLTMGRLWLMRLPGGTSATACSTIVWVLGAVTLAIGSAHIPSLQLPVGLLLGGSLSNLLESSRRGTVTDYVCLRFWPAFNLADVALTAGAVGLLAQTAILASRLA